MKFQLELTYQNMILFSSGARHFQLYLAVQDYQVNRRGFDIMKKTTIIIIIMIAVIAISVGLYTVLPLFTNTVVDEPLPSASGMILTTSYSGTLYPLLERN
jgi:ABC-type bacteriocin/lantibiotic exporter with double-glycine peptidase domain